MCNHERRHSRFGDRHRGEPLISDLHARCAHAGATRHTAGDLVSVGCMIDSCRQCVPCHEGDEHLCEGRNSWLVTYNGPMKPAAKAADGTNMCGADNTYGGYSNTIVVKEDFAC